jgi:hypothetical protein
MTGKEGLPPMSLLDLLEQDEIWLTRKDGELVTLRLDDMSYGHLANVHDWLVCYSPRLHSAEVSALYGMAAHLGGEQALLDLDRAVSLAEAESSLSWITEKPLLQGIIRRLDGRRDTGGNEHALRPASGLPDNAAVADSDLPYLVHHRQSR